MESQQKQNAISTLSTAQSQLSLHVKKEDPDAIRKLN